MAMLAFNAGVACRRAVSRMAAILCPVFQRAIEGVKKENLFQRSRS
jgi:hypothetical protein